MKLSDICLAIAVVAIWGANAAIGKLAIPQVPAFTFLVLRFALTGLIFLPFVDWQRRHVIAALKIAVLLNVLHYGFIFNSFAYLDASALSIIAQSQVPAAVLIGMLVFGESADTKVWLGILLGFAGLLLVKTVESVSWTGFALAFAGSLMWGAASVEMKRQEELPVTTFMALTTLFSVPFLIFAALVFDHDITARLAAANWYEVGGVLSYQIILGSFAMMAWKKLMVRNDVKKITPITLLTPLFGVTAGMIIFNEVVTFKMIVGGLVTMSGVALVMINRPVKQTTD
jgi:O-acetylserine/cysteine efflux transporter